MTDLPEAPAAASEPTARRWPRRVVVGVVVLVLAAILGVAVYFADQLTLPPTVRPFDPDNEIVSTDGEGPSLVLGLRDEGYAAQAGRWGLQLADGGHVQLVEQLDRSGGVVRWRAEAPDGSQPSPGDPVRIDEYGFVGDPSAVGLTFVDVDLWPGDDADGAITPGALPAWYVPSQLNPAGTVVYVHGRGATREEGLKFLPALHDAGWDVLVISYRGDEGAPGLEDDRLRYGTAEWADLDAAVQRAQALDYAEPMVLFGSSMGGSLVAQFMDRSTLATDIDGVILDSPLLSMDVLLDLQAGLNGIPSWAAPVVLPVVQVVADTRYGLDSASLEQGEADDTFDLPTLLFHGDADGFVPFDASRDLAEASDTVTWERYPEAGHVRSWNIDPDGYDAALIRFLASVEDR